MELSRQDRDLLDRLEEELWREETRFDARRMREVIAPDFLEFGRSGRVYRRDDSLAVPRQPIHAVLPATERQSTVAWKPPVPCPNPPHYYSRHLHKKVVIGFL